MIDLLITDLTHEGSGVGHFNGMAVFVPHSAIGDRLSVRIVKVLKSHAYGIIMEISEPSPDRIKPDCPVFTRCGGCSLRHISYSAELRAKQRWVESNLRRIGGMDLTGEPILPSPRQEGYRNKGVFPVRRGGNGQLEIGMYAPRSHNIVPVETCLLHPPVFGDLIAVIKRFLIEKEIPPYDERTLDGLIRHIYIRQGEITGQVMVCLVINGDSLPEAPLLIRRIQEACPGLASFCVNKNKKNTNVILGGETETLYGNPVIQDVLCGIKLNLSPHSFYQVNRQAAELLYHQAIQYADCSGSELLVDLYCGAGAIGLAFSGMVREVIGVEAVEQAVENAGENAAANGKGNLRFLHADAARAARRLQTEGLRPDIVVVDPPRKGCDASVLESIAAMKPGRVLYLSCNSATLARDCRHLSGFGYQLTRYRPVDLFPRTAGVETVALLCPGQR